MSSSREILLLYLFLHEHYSKGAGKNTWDISTLCLWLLDAVAVLLRSLLVKALSGAAIVMERRIACLQAHDSFVPSHDFRIKYCLDCDFTADLLTTLGCNI